MSQDQPAGSESAPVVTVITVCWNAAATLEACLASVAEQTYPRIEHIVIDGSSSDGTNEILARHRDRLAVLVSEPDGGIYDAMNKGLARASGSFVLFLNADDFFAGPDAVADAVAEIKKHPGYDVYYGSLLVRLPGETIRHDPPAEDKAAEEMVVGCLPHQATFARRSVFFRTGPFDVRWRRHADYDWWLKVLAEPSIRVRRIRTLVASFALGGASSDLAKGQPEVYAIQNAAPLYRSAEWDRRRIELLQQALLDNRMEVARLSAAAAGQGIAGSPATGPRWTRRRLRRWAIRTLPEPAVRAISRVKRGVMRALGMGAPSIR